MNSSLIGDISEFYCKFTKFPVVILRGSVDKTFFSISRDHIISESYNSVSQFGASVVTNYYKLAQPLLLLLMRKVLQQQS